MSIVTFTLRSGGKVSLITLRSEDIERIAYSPAIEYSDGTDTCQHSVNITENFYMKLKSEPETNYYFSDREQYEQALSVWKEAESGNQS